MSLGRQGGPWWNKQRQPYPKTSGFEITPSHLFIWNTSLQGTGFVMFITLKEN